MDNYFSKKKISNQKKSSIRHDIVGFKMQKIFCTMPLYYPTDFLHTVGLKALLVAISSPQSHISVEEAPSNIVQIEDLSLTNTQTMVTKLLQTSHILCNAQVRNIFIYVLSQLILL